MGPTGTDEDLKKTHNHKPPPRCWRLRSGCRTVPLHRTGQGAKGYRSCASNQTHTALTTSASREKPWWPSHRRVPARSQVETAFPCPRLLRGAWPQESIDTPSPPAQPIARQAPCHLCVARDSLGNATWRGGALTRVACGGDGEPSKFVRFSTPSDLIRDSEWGSRNSQNRVNRFTW